MGARLGAAWRNACPVLFIKPSELGVFGSISWLLFFAFITWNELRGVLKQREVTSETISMSISVYLLMGFTWGFLYSSDLSTAAHAFSFPASDRHCPPAFRPRSSNRFPVLIYFSLTTLSTIGFGDITPVTIEGSLRGGRRRCYRASSIWRSWSRDWWGCR